jgi:hypothetical protein
MLERQEESVGGHGPPSRNSGPTQAPPREAAARDPIGKRRSSSPVRWGRIVAERRATVGRSDMRAITHDEIFRGPGIAFGIGAAGVPKKLGVRPLKLDSTHHTWPRSPFKPGRACQVMGQARVSGEPGAVQPRCPGHLGRGAEVSLPGTCRWLRHQPPRTGHHRGKTSARSQGIGPLRTSRGFPLRRPDHDWNRKAPEVLAPGRSHGNGGVVPRWRRLRPRVCGLWGSLAGEIGQALDQIEDVLDGGPPCGQPPCGRGRGLR